MQRKIFSEILIYFPDDVKKEFETVPAEIWEESKEIRIRAERKISINCFSKEYILNQIASTEMILRLVENFSENSLYSFQKEINEGFITLKGGHRVGISGTRVIENEKIKNIKYISSLNIRIAREVKCCAQKLLDKIYKDEFENTLIISPLGCGKTTLLRDCIRFISDGYKNLNGKNIGLVDERSEIAGMYNSVPSFDLGSRTDILDGCDKNNGITMLIRSMSPDVIITDEIGKIEDINSAEQCMNAGVSLITSIHGSSFDDLLNSHMSPLIDKKFFKNIIYL
jgi:stage III sporulation protein AA